MDYGFDGSTPVVGTLVVIALIGAILTSIWVGVEWLIEWLITSLF